MCGICIRDMVVLTEFCVSNLRPHKNVLQILGFAFHEMRPIIILEFLEGGERSRCLQCCVEVI